MFTPEDVSLVLYKQATHGVAPVAPSGLIIPRSKSATGPQHSRNKIDNPGVFSDGFKRMFALGNHKSENSSQIVINPEVIGYFLHGLCGGSTPGVAVGGITPITYKLTKTIIEYLIEVGFGTALFYQHFDHVFSKMSVNLTVEGICTIDFNSTGSGKLVEAVAALDAAPAEAVGETVEYASLTLSQDSVGSTDLSALKFDVDRKVAQKRIPDGTGTVAESKYGTTTVTGELTAYYEDDDRCQKARDKTLIQIDAMLALSGGKSIAFTLTELQMEPKGPPITGDDGIMQAFTFESIKNVSADAPFMAVVNATLADASVLP